MKTKKVIYSKKNLKSVNKIKKGKKGFKNTREYKLFGSRSAIDNHTADVLTVSTKFKADLENIREKFLIPTHLKPSSDVYFGYLMDPDHIYDDLFGSAYVHDLLNKKNREQFKKTIIDMIEEYKLGMNFFTWIQWYVMYQEPLFEGVALNLNILKQTRKYIVEPFRIARNTQEKKFLLSWYRDINKIPSTGRIPKNKAKYYKYFKELLDKKKLKFRKPRVDHSIDFQVIERHGKTESLDLHDIKITYPTLVADLFPYATKEEDIEKVNVIKKRKERLKKQIKNLEN